MMIDSDKLCIKLYYLVNSRIELLTINYANCNQSRDKLVIYFTSDLLL